MILEKKKKKSWQKRYFVCGENNLMWYKKNPTELPDPRVSLFYNSTSENLLGFLSLYSIVAITPCPKNPTNTFYLDTSEFTMTLRALGEDSNLWIR
jgi:hypothetical protein